MHAVVHESHRARRGRLAEAEVQESPAREEHLAFNVVEQVGDEAAWDATLAILAGGQDPLQLRLGHQLLLSALHFVVVLLVRALGASDRVLAGEGHLVHFLGFAARAIRLLLVSLQNSIPVLLALLVLVETRHVDVECPARPPDAGLHAARHVRLNGVFEEEGAEGAPEHGQLRPETTREGILGGAVRDGDDHSFAVAAHGELQKALQRVVDALLLMLGRLTLGTGAVALDIGQTEALEIVATNPELRSMIENATPLRRLGDPDDIAAAVLYLASQASSYVTGQIIAVDGGVTTTNFNFPIADL